MSQLELSVTDAVVPVLAAQRSELQRRARHILGLRSATRAAELGARKPNVNQALWCEDYFGNSRERDQARRVVGG